MNRGRKRRKGPSMRAEQPCTSNSAVSEGQQIPSEGQEISSATSAKDTVLSSQEDELDIPATKRSRLELGPETQPDHEPATAESTNLEHSQDDVMIVGDVQIARPEVIDLEKLPTIRQGGSVVVDLTTDASFHENNVVDLTRENALDASIDSSPVVVCVNRIYRGDSLNQRSSCRFAAIPDMLDGIPCLLDDEIQEVMNSNVPSDRNAKLDSTSCTTGDGGDGPSPKKITCPICLDDERTLKRGKRQLTSTTCGHVFCDKCIRNAVQMQSKCPTCRKRLTLNKLHPIFL